MTAILECVNLSVRFGGLKALSGVSMSVKPGEVLGIFGPNGAGKTTLFNAITGHAPSSEGVIWYKGQSISGLGPDRIYRLGLARTFQIPELVESQSVEANVLLGAQFAHGGHLSGAFRIKEEAREAAENGLRRFGLRGVRNKRTALTTLYERKLIMIASALAAKPDLILLDEPAGGLTDKEIEALTRQIREISHSGTTILLIEHVMPVIMDLSTRVLVLNQGQVIAEGDPLTIRQDPRVRRLYFGEVVG
jgi:branched-chain amino acid transport system ATP-binding protein